MFLSFLKNRGSDKDCERLIVALKRVDKPYLSVENKRALKDHLISSIQSDREFLPFSLGKIAEVAKNLAQRVFLTDRESVVMREKLLAKAERIGVVSPLSIYARNFRTGMSAFLLFVFATTTFFAGQSGMQLAFASTTFLDEVQGNVLVMRDGRLIEGQKDLSLNVGDTVLTRDGSFATVHFLDDSVGRLSPNSKLEIEVLYNDPKNPLVTKVQLLLKEGRLWGRVINLIDDRAVFSVETAEVKAKVSKKASFDLYSKDDVTKISVFDNSVDLVPIDSLQNAPAKTVIAGYQAEVTGEGSDNVTFKPIGKDDPEVEASRVWVAANIAQDEKYSNSIVEDAAVNVLAAEDAGKKRLLTFTDEEFENQKQYFLSGYGELLRAESMLVGGNPVGGAASLQNFVNSMKQIADVLPRLQQKDSVNADLLRRMIKDRLDVQSKDMATFVSGDALYSVKLALEQSSILFAEDGIGKAWSIVSNSGGRLIEVQSMIKYDRIDEAKAVFEEYRKNTDHLVLFINNKGDSFVREKLIDLANQQMQQIKLMTAIEESLSADKFYNFRTEIRALRKKITLQLLDAFNQLDGDIPVELLTELRSFYVTYNSGDNDKDAVLSLFDGLINPAGGLNFIQPDDVGMTVPKDGDLEAKLGVVMIVDSPVTPDGKAVTPDVEVVTPDISGANTEVENSDVVVTPDIPIPPDSLAVTSELSG